MQKFMRKNQVAAMLGVTVQTVNRWVSLGQFPSPIRTGPSIRHAVLWPEDAVHDWIAEREAAGRSGKEAPVTGEPVSLVDELADALAGLRAAIRAMPGIDPFAFGNVSTADSVAEIVLAKAGR